MRAVAGALYALVAAKFKRWWRKGRVEPVIPRHDAPEDSMIPYVEAVRSGRFGNATRNYDLTMIGKWRELFSQGSNLLLFRIVSPHSPLLLF